jgi:hypothetical protein
MLEAYFDGQLDREEMQLLAQHCEQCDTCKENIKKLNQISEYLKACQAVSPDSKTFDTLWDKVENTLVRDHLSLKDYFQNVWDSVYARTRFIVRPALAILFVALLIMVPILERRAPQEVYATETNIKKIESNMPVMVLKTKQKQWTVIWIVPMTDTGGATHETETETTIY